MKKPPILSVYFIKTVCALGIIVYHFAMLMPNLDAPLLLYYANGNWGSCFVTTFFVVSGCLLHYHYGEKLELKNYYIKRWRGLFPMFYLAYLFYMVENFFNNRTLFYKGHPLTYLLTLIGMDGYTVLRVDNYYILGEWFLGAVILMYLLYPFVLRLFRKNPPATFAAVVALYVAFYDRTVTNANPFWTVSSCLVSFCFGMVFCEYREKLTSRISVLISLAGFLVVGLVPMADSLENLFLHLQGIFLFVLLTAVGERIMTNQVAYRVFRELGTLSYPIYLVHNKVLQKISMSWQPQNPLKAAVLLVMGIALILPWAKVLELVSKNVMAWVDGQILRLKERKQTV